LCLHAINNDWVFVRGENKEPYFSLDSKRFYSGRSFKDRLANVKI